MRNIRITIEDQELDVRVTASVNYEMIRQIQEEYGADVIKDMLIQLNYELNNKTGENIEIF